MHATTAQAKPISPARRCRQCGSRLRPVRVVYGYPTPEGQAAETRGEVFFAGCIVGAMTKVCSVCLVDPRMIEVQDDGLTGSTHMAPRPSGIALRQRLAGAVWGHLIGDAVGVSYEFLDAADVGVVELRGGGPHRQPPGTWSDDGALMLALADSFVTGGDFDPEDQGTRFLSWADEGAYTPDGDGRFDIGNATAAALENLRRGIPAVDAGHAGPDDAGNGSLMRILPIALFSDPEPAELLVEHAHLASRVTHADSRCQVACALYVLVGQQLLAGRTQLEEVLEESIARLEGLYRDAPAWIDDTHSAALAQLLERRTSARYGSGYVLDTFWGAWEAFASASDYRGAVETAIRYGGDTDTTAAIAGGLAGLHWGVEGIPREWLIALRGQKIVEPLLRDLLSDRWQEMLD